MKKNMLFLLTGILIGALIFGGIVFAANVTPAKSTVYVDGKKVSVGAYNIDGSNYFKLRDFCSAVDVGVWYDSATDSVYIERDKKYDPGYAGPEGAATATTAPTTSSAVKNNDIEPTGVTLSNEYGTMRLYMDYKNNTNADIARFDIEVNCFDAYGKPVVYISTNKYEGYTQKTLKAGGNDSSYWNLTGFSSVYRAEYAITKYVTVDGVTVEIPESQQHWYYTTRD